MEKKKLVVFSGAGMSAESGISTFRDSGGLWEKHAIEDVATPEAFKRNPEKVLGFYNMRVKQFKEVKPNQAHLDIVELEKTALFDVHVVTQNVDDLHERAGSSNVLHLHGELMKCRSSGDEEYITDMPEEGLRLGDLCPMGYQLRPHVVWFGELVPAMDEAISIVSQAEILLVIGTSLNVYPAAGLINVVSRSTDIFLIDPGDFDFPDSRIRHIKKPATAGIKDVMNLIY